MKKILLIGFLFLAACTTIPKYEEMNDEQLTSRLIYESGLNESLDELPKLLAEGIEDLGSDDDVFKKLDVENFKREFLRSFREENLVKKLEASLNKGLSRDSRLKILKWYQTKLGQKVGDLQTESNSDTFRNHFREWLGDLKSKNMRLEESTLTFAKEMNSLTGTSDFMTELTIGLMRALAVGLQSVDEENKLTREIVDERLQKTQLVLRTVIEPMITLTNYYTFRNLSSSEQEEFLRFLKDEPMAKYSWVVHSSIKKSLVNVADNLELKLMPNSSVKMRNRQPANIY